MKTEKPFKILALIITGILLLMVVLACFFFDLLKKMYQHLSSIDDEEQFSLELAKFQASINKQLADNKSA